MHQLGHSRAHSMQEVQFSSISAITPRLRGGSSGSTSGYCSVTDRRASVRAVTFSPSTSPLPGSPTLHLPSVNRTLADRYPPVSRLRTLELAFQPGGDLAVAADRYQVNSLEGAGVTDLQDLLAGVVDAGVAVLFDGLDQGVRDLQLGQAGQVAGHLRGGEHHHPGVHR